MPISGRYDLPLATFNLPSRNNLQNKPNSAATMSPPVQSLRDSAAATPVGGAALRRRFRIFSFRYREMMSGMTMGGGNSFTPSPVVKLPQPPSVQTLQPPPYSPSRRP